MDGQDSENMQGNANENSTEEHHTEEHHTEEHHEHHLEEHKEHVHHSDKNQTEHHIEQPQHSDEHHHAEEHHKHKGHHTEQHHEHEGHDIQNQSDEKSDDINIDFSKVKDFFTTKNLSWLIILMLVLIPVALTVYIRFLPEYLPATDNWAQSSVYNYYKNQMSQQVSAQYPNLPDANKQALVDKQFNDFLASNKAQLDQQIQQTSAYFKQGFEYQENNHTYTFLGDLDSYFWLRMARNIEAHGTVCDETINGTCWDNHMIAPLGTATSVSLHPLAIVVMHRILDTFIPSVNLMQASFFVPMFVAVIAAIAAFFIGRRIMNNTAGFFAAMFVAVSPIFLTRTLGSDTDVWNVTLPLLIIWMFLEAFESKKLWQKSLFSGLTGLMSGLFAFAWGGGWWYAFDFAIAAIIAFIIFEIVKSYLRHKHITKIWSKDITDSLLVLVMIVVSSAIFVSMFSSFPNFTAAFTVPLQLSSSLKVAAYENLWPNVLTTVAELNPANIPSIVGQISFGMNILFSIALLGVIFSMVKKKPDFNEYLLLGFSAILYLVLITTGALNLSPIVYFLLMLLPVAIAILLLFRDKESKVDVKPALLLTIWFIGMIYASIEGVRFIELLTPAFGIALGVSLGYIYQFFTTIFVEDLKIKEKLSMVIVFVILCLILISPVKAGIDTSKGFVPSMTKGWWDSLTQIRLESQPNAIINSWWDFGHWFKYVADRAVSLDGASQNHPTAHWLGEILQTDSQQRAVAVLRMIDCGSNNAFNVIDEKYNDTEQSENIVSALLLMNQTEATSLLKSKGYSQDQIDSILNLMYCNPPEDYFITSSDMIGKAGVWAHFGLWSFDKAFIVNNIRGKPVAEAVKIMEDRWNYSESYATQIYYEVNALQSDQDMNNWIAPWPSYASGSMIACQTNNQSVLCNLNMAVGNTNAGTIVLEQSLTNLSSNNTQLLIAVYDQYNRKLQESLGSFADVIYYDTNNVSHEYTSNNASVALGLLINAVKSGNQTNYQALVADPLLIKSTFTKLFYLDGKGMDHFQKFSDVTDITGSRIIIWKVKW